MITITELRIGNKLFDGEVIRTVTGIMHAATGDEIFLDGVEVPKSLHNLQAVPLSKEIIESCWFEESDEGLWYEYNSATLYPIYLMVINGRWDFSLADPREVAFWNPIYSLHQLQNLHFALSGVELACEV